MDDRLTALRFAISEIGPMAVAVSGGVDSMTLAHVAHEVLGAEAMMVHARSPAVPGEATDRIRRHADETGWSLVEINAGEMQDPRYLENPVNRCFFCKSNLYGRIAGMTDLLIASGTNTDDLGDYRPGLEAAKDYRVRHPYVEIGLAKSDVRAVARSLSLGSLAELPAAPCLSSRIETGLQITSDKLTLVDLVETALRDLLGTGDIRCRVRAGGITVELENRLLDSVDAEVRRLVGEIVIAHGYVEPVVFEPYRKGSAFLRGRS
ncbi:MAG: adenine nucleotide alpha hydrolase [Rhodospirillaceae bacterium]|nr:adenine nucleotide alpha hydrolase [Rhodospirillaceae bacterium]